MIPLVLALTVVVAQQQPTASARLDRDQVNVGDEVTLTVTAQTTGAETATLVDQPRLGAFQLLGTSRASTFNFQAGVGIRTTTWEFRLRAMSPGRVVLGPVRVRAGDMDLETGPLVVDVESVDEEEEAALAARIAQIVGQAPGPDGSEDVIVTVVADPDTVVLGEQLDLVVVAWFPRDVRARLRTRPTLTPPELRGAWTYAQNSALGVAATRQVDGRAYDLFVHSQVVFPLTAGRFEVGAATVAYNLPLRMSILSREVPQEVQSRPIYATVLPPPAAGRPPNYGSAAGAGLELGVTIDTAGFAQGQLGTLTATVSGRGNVALWPEPRFDWPIGLRVYPGDTDVQIVTDDGVVGGSKSFTYQLVPDSAGGFAIPAATFPYFDVRRRSFVTLRSEPVNLVARIGAINPPSEPPVATALAAAEGPPLARRVVTSIPPWTWLAVLLIPPLIAVARPARRWFGRQRVRHAARPVETLESLDQGFRVALSRLVHGDVQGGEELAAALRAAGVEAPVAAHAVRLRERLRQARYGPEAPSDRDELGAEVREMLKVLPGSVMRPRPRDHRGAAAGLALLMTTGVLSTLAAQDDAEAAFRAGRYAEAARVFQTRAQTHPDVPAHWVNLGLTLEAMEEAARARAAWLRAARLDPRDTRVHEAQRRLGALDPVSAELAWVAPVTADEALLGGLVLWIAGWVAAMLRARRPVVIGTMVAAAVAVGYTAYVARAYSVPVALVHAETPLREAPYGPAAAARSLSPDTAVLVEREEGAWVLVRRGEMAGWVLADGISRV